MTSLSFGNYYGMQYSILNGLVKLINDHISYNIRQTRYDKFALKIDGIAFNDHDLDNIHEYNADVITKNNAVITDSDKGKFYTINEIINTNKYITFPPICIWTKDSLFLLGSGLTNKLGIYIVPRNPRFFECKFLRKPSKYIRIGNSTDPNDPNYGKFLRLNICKKCNTIKDIIKYHVIKMSVDGHIDAVIVNKMPIEGTRGQATLLYWNRYTEKKLNIVVKNLGPICVWSKKSILFLAKNEYGDLFIYKLARNPTDYLVNYVYV